MHAATREDIVTVRNELKEDIASVKTEVNIRIDRLDGKIGKVIWFIVASIFVQILMQVAPHLLKLS